MKHRLRLAPSQELEVPHGGAGGRTRTHKGFRPETCEVSAFTSFATPAPHGYEPWQSRRTRRETPHALPLATARCKENVSWSVSNERGKNHLDARFIRRLRPSSRVGSPGATPRGKRNTNGWG